MQNSMTQNKAITLRRQERKVLLRERYGILTDLARKLKVNQSLVTRVSLGQAVSARVARAWNAAVEEWRSSQQNGGR